MSLFAINKLPKKDDKGKVVATFTKCPPQAARGIDPNGYHVVKPKRSAQRRNYWWDETVAWQRLAHNPYKSLAKAKIVQYLCDLGTRSLSEEAQFFKMKAGHWFFGGGKNQEDFYGWCDIADLHPDDIRAIAADVRDQGLHWRAAPGMGKRYHERKVYRQQAAMMKKQGLLYESTDYKGKKLGYKRRTKRQLADERWKGAFDVIS